MSRQKNNLSGFLDLTHLPENPGGGILRRILRDPSHSQCSAAPLGHRRNPIIVFCDSGSSLPFGTLRIFWPGDFARGKFANI